MKLSVLLTVVVAGILSVFGLGYYLFYVTAAEQQVRDFKKLDDITNSFANYLLRPEAKDWRRKIELSAKINGESPFGDGKRGLSFREEIIRNVIYSLQQDPTWADNWGGDGARFDGVTLLKYRRAFGGGF